MEHRNLPESRKALVAIKGIVGDALASPHCVHPPRPKLMRMTRTELAVSLRRLQHGELCHYLRCVASREVLQMIRESVVETLLVLDVGDEQTEGELEMFEPYRHRLYATAVSTALLTAERESLRRERAYWLQQHAGSMKLAVGA